MRICSTCKIEKPITEFYKNLSKKSKISSQCKECVNIIVHKRLNTEKGFIKSVVQIIFSQSKIKHSRQKSSMSSKIYATFIFRIAVFMQVNRENIGTK
jgi:coenzyme F420-reducing hydrogenase beta subunit